MAKRVKTKSEIEAEVKIHVEAEKKAHFMVEHLVLVESVSENELCDIVNLIMVNHYTDVAEERSISHICGYPLCTNKLKKRKKQQFHISLKQQKVYDITERQCFCSDFCYRASKFVESQIPPEPIWLRSKKENLKFLHKDEMTEVRITSEGDIEEYDEQNNTRMESKNTSFERYDQFEEDKSPTKSSEEVIKKKNQIKLLTSKEDDLIASIEKLQRTLLQWFEGYKIDKNTTPVHCQQTSLAVSKNKEEDDFQRKALSFLSTNADWTNEAADLSEDFKQKMNLKNSDGVHFMPLVDSKSQGLLRKKIFKEKVNSSLDRLQPITGLNKSDFLRWNFYSFLEKLRLNRENIVLKPKEWILATICLLKIFSHNQEDLMSCLHENTERIDEYLKTTDSPNILTLDSICDKITSSAVTTNTKAENDGDNDSDSSDDEDDGFGVNIFPDSCGANLSTICEYEDFEELD